MERWEEGGQKTEQNRREMAASQCQTANETQHTAGGDDECRKEHISIDGVGGGGEKNNTFCDTDGSGHFPSGGLLCGLRPAGEGKGAKVSEWADRKTCRGA